MKDTIVKKADEFVHEIYSVTKSFPKDELYGVISQIRRAALSIVLNLIEGYARYRSKEYIHFLEISYASLKETKYLLYFSLREKYISREKYDKLIGMSEEIGKMIWVKMTTMKRGN